MTVPDPTARAAGPGVRVLLESVPDTASVNIADHLRGAQSWNDTGARFDDRPILRLDGTDDIHLATIHDWHIRREGIGEELAAALGAPIEAILVLSRHRAASGVESFTTHPVGNPGAEAIAGGRPRTPTPTHPHILSAAYRALQRHAADSHLPHTVSLEATHHGPETAVPIVFIEIGSDDRHWTNAEAGRVVASAALDAVQARPDPEPMVFMGIGSGHYAPRFCGVLDDTPASVGHMLAAYHWKDGEGVARKTLDAFLEASAAPGRKRPDGVYLDKKSLRGEDRQRILLDLEALDVPVVRTADVAA